MSISQLKIVSSAILIFQYAILYRKSTIYEFKYTVRQFKQAFCRQKHEILHFETIVLQFKHYSLIQTGNSSIPTRNLLGQICTLFSALNKGLSMDEGLNQVWNWPNCLIRRCPLSDHDLKSTRSFWVSEDELL